ncbi:MAG: hypothetical protein KY469_01440 [Actinobacteria bacterium]|nr:hypothetical protein [Actinomycetota bacterium]
MPPRLTRLLIAGLVAGLVVLGVVQVRSEQHARVEAELAEASFAYSQALSARGDELFAPTQAASQHLAALEHTLQEHLTLTERLLDAVISDRERLESELQEAAVALELASQLEPPEVPRHLIGTPGAQLADELTSLRERAADLATQLRELTEVSQRWSSALVMLEQRARAYVELVESHDPSTDPQELAEAWRAERAPLHAYLDATSRAVEVDGLEPYAMAHRDYVEANLAWVDEAVGLLEAGELDAYNRRYEELFGGPDPFGFTAATTAGAEVALDRGAVAASRAARRMAVALLDDLAKLRRRIPAVLAPAPSPSAT